MLSLVELLVLKRHRGIYVGSTRDQQDLCNFLAEKKVDLKPLVDKQAFAFENALEAFQYLSSGKHIGNVIIKVA